MSYQGNPAIYDRPYQGPSCLADRLADLHGAVRRDFPSITRVSVAVYDEETDLLKTFVDSTDGERESPLEFYSAPLTSVPSLKATAESGQPRVIDDLPSRARAPAGHTVAIINAGVKSSYTLPLHQGRRFLGFLFLDSREGGFFGSETPDRLETHIQAIAATVRSELMRLGTLRGALATLRSVGRYKDEETDDHLERMSRYAALIARRLAPAHGLSDAHVEYLQQIAPLHDIGKIAIPDHILLKPGPLTPEEFAVMQTHVRCGTDIVDSMIDSLHLDDLCNIAMLRNIVGQHHEAVDGSGYPLGLKGDALPLESRIVTVADVFDALTSDRPYKKAWTNAEAFRLLRLKAGSKFDPEVVDALLSETEAVETIQARFPQSADPMAAN